MDDQLKRRDTPGHSANRGDSVHRLRGSLLTLKSKGRYVSRHQRLFRQSKVYRSIIEGQDISLGGAMEVVDEPPQTRTHDACAWLRGSSWGVRTRYTSKRCAQPDGPPVRAWIRANRSSAYQGVPAHVPDRGLAVRILKRVSEPPSVPMACVLGPGLRLIPPARMSFSPNPPPTMLSIPTAFPGWGSSRLRGTWTPAMEPSPFIPQSEA
jgi:hypothetical protein